MSNQSAEDQGMKLYLIAMWEQYDHDPDSVDWSEVYDMMEEMQADDCYVDEIQSERTDWRS